MWTALTLTEGQVLLWLQQELRGPWDGFLLGYTQLGDGGFLWIFLSCLLLAHPRTRRLGFVALVALLIGFVLNNLLLKPWVDRLRPGVSVAGLRPLLEHLTHHSFPSGHTCAAFAAAVVWMRGVRTNWAKGSLLVAAVLMGFSRLYKGEM